MSDVADDRKALHDKLRRSEERARMVAELAADASYGVVVHADGTLIDEWTAGDYEGLSGYGKGELAARDWAKVVHPEDRGKVPSLATALKEGRPERIDLRIIRKDGQVRWVTRSRSVWRDAETNTIHVIGTVQDITDRVTAIEAQQRLEGYLRHMQKIEALGALAGGVAHDFNNLLYIMIGNAELALRKLGADDTARRNVEEILSVGRRGAELTAKILAFSRPELAEGRTSDIDEVTAEAITLLRATLPSSVAIELASERASHRVRLGSTDLHQILINLFTNASEAMPHGGRIQVSIEPVAFLASDPPPEGVAAGHYVRLVVADNGCGMAPDVVGRIFEPRYTTKSSGHGSGMGLAVVQGIVHGFGGTIECTSSPGQGTTFSVILPAIERRRPEGAAGVSEVRGRILFVDDEPDVVRMAREMLELLGYEVEARTSSVEALKAFRAAPSRYDLVLTDQTMPELTGDALVREIRRVRPEIPVILCSGYHDRVRPEVAEQLAIQACLQKPIDIDALSRVLRGALGTALSP
jgi:two-component system cell cycle sensor histidine kinase/response regulator CckA